MVHKSNITMTLNWLPSFKKTRRFLRLSATHLPKKILPSAQENFQCLTLLLEEFKSCDDQSVKRIFEDNKYDAEATRSTLNFMLNPDMEIMEIPYVAPNNKVCLDLKTLKTSNSSYINATPKTFSRVHSPSCTRAGSSSIERKLNFTLKDEQKRTRRRKGIYGMECHQQRVPFSKWLESMLSEKSAYVRKPAGSS
ncbi:hypothetical protein COOONC_14122 [Cooperia oncophora]